MVAATVSSAIVITDTPEDYARYLLPVRPMQTVIVAGVVMECAIVGLDGLVIIAKHQCRNRAHRDPMEIYVNAVERHKEPKLETMQVVVVVNARHGRRMVYLCI